MERRGFEVARAYHNSAARACHKVPCGKTPWPPHWVTQWASHWVTHWQTPRGVIGLARLTTRGFATASCGEFTCGTERHLSNEFRNLFDTAAQQIRRAMNCMGNYGRIGACRLLPMHTKSTLNFSLSFMVLRPNSPPKIGGKKRLYRPKGINGLAHHFGMGILT